MCFICLNLSGRKLVDETEKIVRILFHIFIASFIKIFLILVDTYMIETLNILKLFEKDCMETYRNEEKKKHAESMESRIDMLQKK